MSPDSLPTPLAQALVARIRREGAMSVRAYMDACLNDPQHGYYRSQPAIGAAGDFITAPEISQVFGELIGLWAAVVWQSMGAPPRVRLVELGPGRGTLMRDLLRAVKKVPLFLQSLEIVLVEPNTTLAALQREVLAQSGQPASWFASLSAIPDLNGAATILVANEVLDVLPVAQMQFTPDGWLERGVHVDAEGKLAFTCLEGEGVVIPGAPPAHPGDILELRDTRTLTAEVQRLARGGPLAGLFIDYGYDEGPALGDTLQAMRAQVYEHPLASPGEADLTAHVDFRAFGADVAQHGLVADGPVPQGTFLGALGMVERTSRLMALNPRAAPALEASTARLMAPTGMGTLFKVMGVRSRDVPPLPGL